jgi:hypothetical protein
MYTELGSPSRYSDPHFSYQRRGRFRSGNGPFRYLSRLKEMKQLDFELASWQMIHLCLSPRKV